MATEKWPARVETDYKYKLLAVGLADELGHEVVFTILRDHKDGSNMTVRSDSSRVQVEWNADIDDQLKKTGKYNGQWWCDECYEGDYFHCSYRSDSSKLSCPEYYMKEGTKESYTPVKTDALPKGPSKPWRPLGKPKTTDHTIEVKPKDKSTGKPITIGDLTKTQPKPVLPHGLYFKCPSCGHWFGSESKLAGHTTHACPGKNKDLTWAIKCECCDTLDDVIVSRIPAEVKQDVIANDKEGGS